MYTRNRKPNWLLMCMVLLTILIVCLYVKIKSKPIEVVVSDNNKDQHLCTIYDTSSGQDNELTAGVFRQVNNYLNQSSLEDAQINGVVVTDSQQDFYFKEAKVAVEAEESQEAYMDKLLTEKYEYFELSERDEYLLAKLIQCEAGNQPMEAKEAVVMVVLNRVDDIRFPNTIEEVIRQNVDGIYQFSPLMEGGSFYYTEPTEESYKAIYNVQHGVTDLYLWCDYLWFECCESSDNWHSHNLEFTKQIGDIRFYR